MLEVDYAKLKCKIEQVRRNTSLKGILSKLLSAPEARVKIEENFDIFHDFDFTEQLILMRFQYESDIQRLEKTIAEQNHEILTLKQRMNEYPLV